MAHTPGGDLPRYAFHVQPGSELIRRLEEMARRPRRAATCAALAAMMRA